MSEYWKSKPEYHARRGGVGTSLGASMERGDAEDREGLSQNISVGLTFFVGAISGVAFLYFYSFNWPYIDDFAIAKWYREIFITRSISVFDTLFFTTHGPHPLGIPAVLTAYSFAWFGPDYTWITYGSLLLIIGSALLVFLAVRDPRMGWAQVALSASIILILMHPTQVKHFLWAFEICWFLITFFMAMNLFLVEHGSGWVVLAPVIALLGSDCSAHGVFLFPALAMHLWLKKDAPYRLTLLSLSLLGFLLFYWSISRHSVDAPPIAISELPTMGVYFVSLVGGVFGINNALISFVIGVVLLTCIILVAISMLRQSSELTRADRVSAVLIAASLMMALAFTRGRSQYGLAWVFETFHAAPLLVPLVLGMAVWSIGRTGMSRSRVGIIPGVIAFASLLTSLPYARSEAASYKLHQQVALLITCSPETSLDDATRINIGPLAYASLVSFTLPVLRPLCIQHVDDQAFKVSAFPQQYTTLIAQDPAAEKPLKALWMLYLMRSDLLKAFHPDDAQRAEKLLNWAIASSKSGPLFPGDDQRPYEGFFRSKVSSN